jgi:predicted ArsR family transcriptional regulator
MEPTDAERVATFLVRTSDGPWSAETIAERLEVDERRARDALERLAERGIAAESDDGWTVADRDLAAALDTERDPAGVPDARDRSDER